MRKLNDKPKGRKAAKPKPTDYNEVLVGVVELLDGARGELTDDGDVLGNRPTDCGA